jgi:hypothetical protein
MNRSCWPALRALVSLWVAWFCVVYVFQALVTARLDVRRPDLAVFWTRTETAANSQDNKPYLLEPFLNRQVSWDSEYYLSIALAGYDDPIGRRLPPTAPAPLPLNYAFFPLYPWAMRPFLLLFLLFGLAPIAAASLAGVVVALLGTLGGLVALWDLARDELGPEGGLRAAFFLLIFPTGFFLAQVYTEGLFTGLAFGALALARRRRWGWAALLAALAALTRAHGAALALPLLASWLLTFDRRRPLRPQLTPARLLPGLLALAPLAVYLAWRLSALGQNWHVIQIYFFRRGLLALGESLSSWAQAFDYAQTSAPAAVYFWLEVASIALAALAGLALLRRQPAVALFSLAVVLLSVFSGVAQSLARYVLVAPATFLWLAALGRRPVFDRAWTMASLLLFGLSAMLFSFDMWVG